MAMFAEDAAQLAAAARGARRLLADAFAAGTPTAADVPVGTPWEHVGTASGHRLHLYGSAPRARPGRRPSGLPPVPAAARDVPGLHRAGAGGRTGVVVELDRVLAFYVDTGTVIAFAAP